MSHAALVTPPVAGPSGPDHPPAPSTPEESHDEDPFQFLDADKLQEMRDQKKRLLTEEQDKVSNKLDATEMDAARARAQERADELYQDYLLSFNATRNLDEDDPKYEEYLNYVAQIGNMSDTEWRTGEYINGEQVNVSGRDMVDDLHDKLVEDHRAETTDDHEEDEAEPATPDVPPVVDDATVEMPLVPTGERRFTAEQLRDVREKVEARGEAHADLLNARNRLAELTVKRQGKLGGKGGEEFQRAQEEYQRAMIAYGQAGEAMLGAMQDERTEVERRADVVNYLLHEAVELRKVTNEKWNNTTVNKICAWMARGNVAQRIAKGMLVGGGVAAAAAAVGAVTGGTGLLTVAGAGAAAARMMRAYGSQRGRNLVRGHANTDMTGVPGHTMNARRDFMFEQAKGMRGWPDVYSADAILVGGSNYLLEEHEKNISAEHKRNRRAAAISIASVAIPAAGMYVGAEVVEHHTHFREAVSDKLHEWFGGGKKTELSQVVNPNQPGGSTPTEIAPQPAPTADELLKQLTPDQLNALNIKSGEGGIRLMESIGGKPSDWYEMQNDLLKAHPEDFYRMPDGNVGLAHTGRLSNETMVDIATRMGYIH